MARVLSIRSVLGAIAVLGIAAVPQDVDDCIRQLGSDDVQVRNRANDALLRLWERDDVKKRLEELGKRSTDAHLRACARAILSRMELRRKLGKPLVEAVGDVEGFLAAGDQRLAAAFETWVEDPKQSGPEAAERRRVVLDGVVSRLTSVEDKSRLLEIVNRRVFQWEFVSRADGDPGLWVGGIASLLKDEAAQIRADTADLLGRARAKRFEMAIVELLSDPEGCCLPFIVNCEKAPGCQTCGRPPVGAHAAAALADLGAGGAAKEIARFLKHAHPKARILAAGALGKLKATAFADDLAPLLDDDDIRVQVASADALAELGAKAQSARIARLLRAPDAWVRNHALEALGNLQAQDQVGEIRALLRDERPGVRGNAARALGRLGRKECADEIAAILSTASKEPRDDFFSVLPAVEALRLLEAKGTARALKRAALDKSERLGCFTVPNEATPERPWKQITLAELVDEILRGWGIDPESLKD